MTCFCREDQKAGEDATQGLACYQLLLNAQIQHTLVKSCCRNARKPHHQASLPKQAITCVTNLQGHAQRVTEVPLHSLHGAQGSTRSAIPPTWIEWLMHIRSAGFTCVSIVASAQCLPDVLQNIPCPYRPHQLPADTQTTVDVKVLVGIDGRTTIFLDLCTRNICRDCLTSKRISIYRVLLHLCVL